MTFINYSEYIQSPAWKKKRGDLWRKYKVCQICGKGWDLAAHHLTYTTLGYEDIDRDIVLVCASCHHACHWTMGVFKIPLEEKLLRKRFHTLQFRRTRHILNLRPSHIIGWIGDFAVFLVKLGYRMYSVR